MVLKVPLMVTLPLESTLKLVVPPIVPPIEKSVSKWSLPPLTTKEPLSSSQSSWTLAVVSLTLRSVMSASAESELNRIPTESVGEALILRVSSMRLCCQQIQNQIVYFL